LFCCYLSRVKINLCSSLSTIALRILGLKIIKCIYLLGHTLNNYLISIPFLHNIILLFQVYCKLRFYNFSFFFHFRLTKEQFALINVSKSKMKCMFHYSFSLRIEDIFFWNENVHYMILNIHLLHSIISFPTEKKAFYYQSNNQTQWCLKLRIYK
jgi:hypothetical protein